MSMGNGGIDRRPMPKAREHMYELQITMPKEEYGVSTQALATMLGMLMANHEQLIGAHAKVTYLGPKT